MGLGLRRLQELAFADEVNDTEVAELLEGLNAPLATWRLTALQGLARHDPAAAFDGAQRLRELNCESDPFLRASLDLILASGGVGDPKLLAGRALGRLGRPQEGLWPPRPLPARRCGLGWPLRRLAVQALGQLEGADRSVIRRVARTDPDWAVREEAVLALRQPRDEADEGCLVECTEDPRLAVRRAAANALGNPLHPYEGEERFAWRVPGFEPYFRYFAGTARREYAGELNPGTRHGSGRNWGTFGVWVDIDLGEDAPEDLDASWPLVSLLGIDTALTQARDLLHHPGVGWADDPTWPVCCADYTVFHGHSVELNAPVAGDIERWFAESLLPDLPLPGGRWEELDGERYVFRCGFCGTWWTCYALL
jgi:HEAT repeat protein